MSEKEDSPTDASGTEKKTADRGSEVPGRPLENKQGFGEESTTSTQEKENDGIANPSSHQDLEVKPPLTTIKTGMISSFYNVKIRFICIDVDEQDYLYCSSYSIKVRVDTEELERKQKKTSIGQHQLLYPRQSPLLSVIIVRFFFMILIFCYFNLYLYYFVCGLFIVWHSIFLPINKNMFNNILIYSINFFIEHTMCISIDEANVCSLPLNWLDLSFSLRCQGSALWYYLMKPERRK